jgi:hypothetical protein
MVRESLICRLNERYLPVNSVGDVPLKAKIIQLEDGSQNRAAYAESHVFSSETAA